jgi:hypothetical protein
LVPLRRYVLEQRAFSKENDAVDRVRRRCKFGWSP